MSTLTLKEDARYGSPKAWCSRQLKEIEFLFISRQVKKIKQTVSKKQLHVVMPQEDGEALFETKELLDNPVAMKTLQAAKKGKLTYKELNLTNENFGLWFRHV